MAEDQYRQSFLSFLQTKFLESVQRSINPPFSFVIGSSGLGKTQLAFSLYEERVIYVPVSTCTGQLIYAYFSNFYVYLRECILKDLKTLTVRNMKISVSSCSMADVSMENIRNASVFGFNSFTAGFLIECLTSMKHDGGHWAGSYDISRLPDFYYTEAPLAKLLEVSEHIVFILDEFYAENLEKVIITFLRNLLRLCRFRVVVMGTHCCAANMFSKVVANSSQGSVSYQDGAIWCYIWHALPKSSPKMHLEIEGIGRRLASVYPALQNTIATLLHLVDTERPLIAHYLKKFFVKNLSLNEKAVLSSPVAFFDAFVDFLRDGIFYKKPSLVPLRHAYNFNYWFSVDSGAQKLKLVLVNSHFAVFSQNNAGAHFLTAYIRPNHGSLYVDYAYRTELFDFCFSTFRSFKDETLLRMALMGYKNVHWDLKGVSFATLFKESCEVKRNPLSQQHKLLLKRDGDALESMMRLAIVQSTHAKGLFGVTFYDFLVRLCQNIYSPNFSRIQSFYFNNQHPGDLQEISISEMSTFQERIPFLGAIGAEWHSKMIDWAVANGVMLGTAMAPEDRIMTDMLSENVTFGVLGDFEDDAKHDREFLDDELPTSILESIPNRPFKDAGKPSLRVKRVFAMESKNWNRPLGNPQLSCIFLKNVLD